MKHKVPTLGQSSFHCPHCGVLSEQTWSTEITCYYNGLLPNGHYAKTSHNLQKSSISKCGHCKDISLWVN